MSATALTLSIVADLISETDGSTTATVTRNTDTIAALTVDPRQRRYKRRQRVPATVTIAAGQITSEPFNIAAVDDAIVDGTQNVTITASATAHANGTDTLNVTDDEVPRT